jgi:hypothetical protein
MQRENGNGHKKINNPFWGLGFKAPVRIGKQRRGEETIQRKALGLVVILVLCGCSPWRMAQQKSKDIEQFLNEVRV